MEGLTWCQDYAALNRDLMQRLESWAEALRIPIGVRHGDTPQSERTRQAKSPPDLLITTPETVQLLLYGDTLRKHLSTVRFVILDEVHDMAQSERGAQLLVALERIEEVVGQPTQLREAAAPERPGPKQSHARPGGGFQRAANTVIAWREDFRPLEDGALEIVHARSLVIHSPRRVGLTLDGEPLRADAPLFVTVQEDALRVVIPS